MSRAKRTLDLVCAGLGVLVLAPWFALLALLVKSEDGGPVFFRQERVGHRGRVFRIWKFRTMVPDAAARGLPLTVGRDPRVTRVGGWLRRLKLDELPQLLNVLVGDMTLVGPRPEVPCYVAEAALLAAALDPERVYVSEIVPDKIRLNLAYAAHATVWTDVRVLLATLGQLLRSSNGAHHTAPADPTDSPLAARITTR